MLVQLLTSLLVASANAKTNFTSWALKHNKTYGSIFEQDYRRSVFDANVLRIRAHNSGNVTWRMGLNKFADLTSREFRKRYIKGAFKRSYNYFNNVNLHTSNITALPSSVDWTAHGAVTPVKNQGQCGSCWAFSTTGSVEGAHFLKNGSLASLSEQQLVDCSDSQGDQGCNGGLMDYAFAYIIANKGITSEANYPYTASDGNCNTRKSAQIYATISGFKDVTPNSDTDLMTALVQQPVSVAVEADQDSFQLYKSGVMTAACGTALDHGVLAVGYGSAGGNNYYKVKNSWGADWGMKGYILLGRGPQYNGGAGQCGILSAASYPVA